MATIGRGILLVWITDPGLGLCGLRFGHPGWEPGLYPPEVWRVYLPKTEVFKDLSASGGSFLWLPDPR
jgi:hypothetical protein